VLEALRSSGKPLGAYDLLDHLATAGKRPAPISVYRALDYLVEHGWAHRLASRSAFIACSHPHERGKATIFMICHQCGLVIESNSERIADELTGLATRARFRTDMVAIEAVGRCSACDAPREAVPALHHKTGTFDAP
jgi:Fur family zinc uptake transcriptional regulator